METALGSSTGIVAYLALFAGVAIVFVFVNLLIGRFLRPSSPNKEKLEIYECGEPAIGSSFVQFDLRFYVVALVFIIFDVEVAFLFPWATVFGKVENLAHDDQVAIVATQDGSLSLTPTAEGVYREMGEWNTTLPANDPRFSGGITDDVLRQGLRDADGNLVRDSEGNLAFVGLQQMLVFSAVVVSFFFVVLLVGFAYEWRTGALDWVRSTANAPPASIERRSDSPSSSQESVLTA